MKCFQAIRELRWTDGLACPSCASNSTIKNGRDDAQPDRQRYECRRCHKRSDDLTDTAFAGHHQPRRTRIACLYPTGLDLSGLQIARELGAHNRMLATLCRGIIDRTPPEGLSGEVECDEVDVLAGHKCHPEAAQKKGGSAGGDT